MPQAFIGGISTQVLFHVTAPAPPGGTKLTFKSNHPDLLTVPDAISLAEQTKTAKFQIATHPVSAETTIRITVAGGAVTLTNTLILHPAPTLSPPPVGMAPSNPTGDKH